MRQWFIPPIIAAIVLSLLIHFLLIILSSRFVFNKKNLKIKKPNIAVKIVTKKNPKNILTPNSSPAQEAEVKKTIEKAKPNVKKISKPIQGLNAASFAVGTPSGEEFSVRKGNSLLVEDKGEMLTEEKSTIDLSADVRFLQFQKPEYTDAALEAELEGDFIVDVLVDEKGRAIDIQLRTEIGFGMDQRIINAIENATFSPRKNINGGSVKAWGEFTIRFELP